MENSVYESIWQKFKEKGRIAKAPRKEGMGITIVVSLHDREVIESISEIQRLIGKAVPFDAIPSDALHITVRNIQSLEEDPSKAPPEKLSAAVSCLRTTLKGWPPFHASLKNVNSFLVNPFIEVHDDGELARIRSSIHPELDRLGLADNETPCPGYVHHVTLGYYKVIKPSNSLIHLFEQLRQREFGQIEIRKLRLVKTLWTRGFYHMEPLEELRLGGDCEGRPAGRTG